MKFVSEKHLVNWYGYDFKPGEEVEVKEKELIKKLRNLDFMKEKRKRATNDSNRSAGDSPT